MRITQNSMNRTQLAGLNGSLGRLQQTQEQLTSGKRLNRPSDSPVDTVQAMRFRADQQALEQYGVNISDGLSRLQATDDAMTRISPMVNRIRQQVVAAANDSNGPEQRAAYAAEIKQLKDAIVQVANTQYAGRPLFGGTAYNPDPAKNNAFDPATGKFVGNTSPVLRKISDGAGDAGQMDIGASGPDAFGKLMYDDASGGPGAIDDILAKLAGGSSADITGTLAVLDDIQAQVAKVQSTIGAKVNRLQGLQELNGRQDDASKVALSKVEDVDFMKAAMDLNIQSNAYNAALQASAKIIQPSLMEFLR